jgi:hypothetical protein
MLRNHAEYRNWLNVMLNVIVLSVIIPDVVILSVVAQRSYQCQLGNCYLSEKFVH